MPDLPLDRRDLLRLAAAGAVSLALPGCPRRPAARVASGPIGGSIHGQDDAFGHLLRDGNLFSRSVDATEQVDTLVIGGGVAGLACAWRLRRDGLTDVLVLDAGKTVGGNARWGESEVSRFPWAAHYLRAPTPEHRSLTVFLEEVGLIRGRDAAGRLDYDTRAVCAAPQERVFEGGLWADELFPPPRSGDDADVAEFRRFDALIDGFAKRRDAEGRRPFAIPLDRSSRDPDLLALDAISFREWIDAQGFTRPALHWLLEYACRDDYGCTLETTSAWAGLHYFASRRGDDPTRDQILTWPEGNGRLVTHLLEAQGPARVQTRALCFRLVPGAASSDPSEALVYHAESDRVVRYRARHLVFAGARFVLARLLESPPLGSEGFTYAPWSVANVTLSEPPGGLGAALAWDNVFFGKPSLGYVVANRDARGPCVVTWYLPLTGADPAAERERLASLDHAAIVKLVTDELYWAHPPLVGKVLSVDAWRWGHAMARPTPGFIWGEARQRATQPIGALLCANADQSGVPVFEEAFYRGVVAGEAILARRGAFETIL